MGNSKFGGFLEPKNKQSASMMPNLNQAVVSNESTKIPDAQMSTDSLGIWLASLPTTDSKLLVSNKIKEQALFDLGKYAKTQMEDNALARVPLKRLLTEFPYTSYEAEALYLSYLSAENKQSKSNFRTQLFDRFP